MTGLPPIQRHRRPARPVSKREIWASVKAQEANGNLEGATDLVKGIAERFGIKSIEVETASEKVRWRD